MTTTLRFLALGAVAALASCASEPTSIFCPTTGIVCPEGTVCAAAQPVCLATSCGNGVLDPGEQCDDGNIIDGDRCSALCRVEECGNNVIDQSAGEDCDDGNAVGGDGCSAICHRESCGNGVTDVGEECDDGNLDNADGCTGTPIEISDGNGGTMRSPEPCMSREICGNGIKDFQVGEVCDDGNTVSGDGCNSDCRSGEGCGNGIVDPGEECDDGDNDDHDRCRNNCKVAVCGDGIVESTGGREQCDGGDEDNPAPVETADCNIDCTTAVCGDGKVNLHMVPPEQCDNGVGQNGDTKNCKSDCQNNICGDGKVDQQAPGIEACDDGNTDNLDDCSNACQSATCGNSTIENDEMCDDGNHDDTDACVECAIAVCGDGKVRAGVEQCDDGNLVNGDSCSSLCRVEGCGNGVLDPGEECDDGQLPSNNPNDAVNKDACVGNCRIAICSDGFVRTGVEMCDDHNLANGDGCSSTCRSEGCGNGQIDPGEQCDDGAQVGGDGCDANCQLERCGDGFVDVGEQCDGNGAGVGGETATCNIDCTMAACDDFKVNTHAGEQCDNGPILNANDHDCRADCKLNTCTDGFRNQFGPDHVEACDDGNTNNTDACSNSCTLASCNNGVINPGEQCDDNNLVETDACLNNCMLNVCGDNKVRTGVEECDGASVTIGGITYPCSPPGTNPPGCRLQRCGNGIIDPGEECDDDIVAAGTTNPASNSGDGCSNQCKIEYCGDGTLNNGEQCDPGPASVGSQFPGENADCNRDCTASSCGDGVLNIADGEQCDDHNQVANDGCSATCRFERCGNNTVDPGEQCDVGATSTASCYGSSDPRGCLSISCGNGRIDTGETCEPPNTRGCSATCQTILYCGDGVVSAGETCDPPGATCNFDCTTSGCGDSKVNPQASPAESCDPGGGIGTPAKTTTCDSNCTPAVCGDSTVNSVAGEECDNGASNSYTGACLPTCQTNDCGDGFVESGVEMCDDGDTMTETSADCTGYNTSCLFCNAGCTAPLMFTGPHCGDGVCQAGSGETNTNCSADCAGTCGNGTTELGEICDYGSGNNNGTDCPSGSPPAYGNVCVGCNACSAVIVSSGGWCGDNVCQAGSETLASCSADCKCGNGIRDAGEQCDNAGGNGDGCTTACAIEAGYYCTGAVGMASTCQVFETCASLGKNGDIGDGCNDVAYYNRGDGMEIACGCDTSGGQDNNTCTGDNATTEGTCTCTPNCVGAMTGDSDHCGSTCP